MVVLVEVGQGVILLLLNARPLASFISIFIPRMSPAKGWQLPRRCWRKRHTSQARKQELLLWWLASVWHTCPASNFVALPFCCRGRMSCVVRHISQLCEVIWETFKGGKRSRQPANFLTSLSELEHYPEHPHWCQFEMLFWEMPRPSV